MSKNHSIEAHTEHTEQPSARPLNSPDFAERAERLPLKARSAADQSKEMEHAGVLPKLELNREQVGFIENAQHGLSHFAAEMQKGIGEAVKTGAYTVDYWIGKGVQSVQGMHREHSYDLGHSSDPALRQLLSKPIDSFNCHYFTKTAIEGAPPVEKAEHMGRSEMVDRAYLESKGYHAVTGTEIHPGDVVLVEWKPGMQGNALTKSVHSAIVENDAAGNPKTIQKLDPDSGVAALTLKQLADKYGVTSGQTTMTVYRK